MNQRSTDDMHVPPEREPVPSSDERDYLLRHLDGDGTAFAELVACYRTPVYSYLARCGVLEAERDDLFQEIFLRIHRGARGYDADRPVHPWLFTIVANAVRTYLRRQRVHALVFRGPGESEATCPAPDSERVVDGRQARRWIQTEILRLPLSQREVLLLAGVERLPQQDVADVLGLPLNTVKTLLRRGRMTLIDRWRRRQGVRPLRGET